MTISTASVKARIERITRAFTRADVPDLNLFASVTLDDAHSRIDDGARYDLRPRQRPEFVTKDLTGWDSSND